MQELENAGIGKWKKITGLENGGRVPPCEVQESYLTGMQGLENKGKTDQLEYERELPDWKMYYPFL